MGIPAYNEAQNIGNLLAALLKQKLHRGLVLSQLLVVSDASTDDTPDIVTNYMKHDSRIELHQLSKRSGKPTVINEIFRLALGDVIVLLDADTLPIGDEFLSKIASPFNQNHDVGITAAVGISMPSESLVGRAAVFSSNVRRQLVHAVPYLAFNIAIAISTKAAADITLPAWIIGDDAYLFFQTQNQGLKTIVSPNARILYREPDTLRDFIFQRTRYDRNVAQLSRIFGEVAKRHMKVPRGLWHVFVEEALRDPIGGVVWLLLRSFLRVRKSVDNNRIAVDSVTSTKAALKTFLAEKRFGG